MAKDDKESKLISVVIPVKNEGSILGRCLNSLKKVDYPRELLEIIIADGMSKDDTRGVALRYGAAIVPNNKEVVVSGRNRGFEKARGDLIAFTDADCVFDRSWLKNSLGYFKDVSIGGVGGLTLSPDDSSDFEKAVDYIFNLAEFFKSTSHNKRLNRAKEVDDIPGCNAIYRREALEKVMPIDEGFLTAEDVWMNFCIRRSGYRLILAPDVILWHYRRNSPKRFLRQAYRFAIGRTQVGKRNLKLFRALHIITGFAIPLFLLTVMSFYFFDKVDIFFKVISAFFIVIITLSFLKMKSFRAAINVPLAIVIFNLGWSAGFLRELVFPMKDVKGG